MTLMKGYIGSGILALPYAFSQGGWVLSTVIFLATVWTLLISIRALLDMADDCKLEVMGNGCCATQGLTELVDKVFGQRAVIVDARLPDLVPDREGYCLSDLLHPVLQLRDVRCGARGRRCWRLDLPGAGPVHRDTHGLDRHHGAVHQVQHCRQHPDLVRDGLGHWYGVQHLPTGFLIDAMINGGHFVRNFQDVANFEAFPMVIGVSVFSMGIVPILFPIRNSMNKQNDFRHVYYYSHNSAIRTAHADNRGYLHLFQHLCSVGLRARLQLDHLVLSTGQVPLM